MFTAACLQLNSSNDLEENLTFLEEQISQAAEAGASFIATPENSLMMMANPQKARNASYPQETHPALPRLAKLAKKHKIYLLIGSLDIKISDDKRANRSFLFGPEGKILTSYDKIHLFDVQLSPTEFYKESDNFHAGEQAEIVETPLGTFGLSICYDVRFPDLYQTLALAGADFLTVPAAFTVPTGKAHWETLLRARAIETGCYVFAPAQCGSHDGGRQTWGHSMIISPWGEILAEATEETEIIYADIDLELIKQVRHKIPKLKHIKSFTRPIT